MNQYRTGDVTQVVDKSGEVIDITLFRSRVVYPANYVVSEKLTQSNYTRPDILAINTYGSFDTIGAIIDVNEKDVFDFTIGDKYNYPMPEVAIV